MIFLLSFLILGFWACEEPKPEDSSVEEVEEVEEETVYGDCSLELVAASGYNYSASSIGAASVVIHLAYMDDTYGLQEEDHPLQPTSSDTWSLELDFAATPEDVVLGASTMWSVAGFTDGDKIFLALTEDNEVCDCWDTNASEVIVKDCTAFGAE
ncbi:MAG: hypothetical protein VX278_05920 [Myxococcota bacterium]|nr:hypothetical protein [Myxococcota bacterium]